MESSQFLDARLGKVCWLALVISSLLLPADTLRSQQQPQISVEVKVVNVLATVRDKHGQIVSNLGKDDFALEEDGHPQTIAYFTRDTDLPLTLGLLVDTSESQRRVLDQERTRQPQLFGRHAARGQGQGLRDSFRSGSGAFAGFDLLARETGERARIAGRAPIGRDGGNGWGRRRLAPAVSAAVAPCFTMPSIWPPTRSSRSSRAAKR